MPSPDGLFFAGSLGHREPLGSLEKHFARGCSYAIVGPNGSGKSTLLATLGGRLNPTAGSTTVGGADVRTKGTLPRIHLVDSPVFA